jgi:hypothetical protein
MLAHSQTSPHLLDILNEGHITRSLPLGTTIPIILAYAIDIVKTAACLMLCAIIVNVKSGHADGGRYACGFGTRPGNCCSAISWRCRLGARKGLEGCEAATPQAGPQR